MSETMKAVRIHGYGGPEVLVYEDAPKPTAGAGQVLIRVHAAGVNPVDWKLRAGYMKGVWDMPLPATLGADIAGTVAAVGEGVTGFMLGDAVYGGSDALGGYAEYVAVKADEIALKPESLSFVEAASVPVVGRTAWQGLFEQASLKAGDTVLIHAASGGVGLFAVQFAKAVGATVIGTASGKNEEFVRSLGVDTFVDYTTTRFEDIAKNVDVVYDAVGAETATRSLAVLKPGGTLICIAGEPKPEDAAKYPEVVIKHFSCHQSGEEMAEFAKRFDAGTLRTYVSATFPLAEVRAAHEQSETGRVRGKIVLEVV